MRTLERATMPNKAKINHANNVGHELSTVMSPSDKFLLDCITLEFNQEIEQEILGWLQDKPDWDDIFARARHHGLMPLLYYHLTQPNLKGYIPEDVLSQLKDSFLFSAINALRAYSVLENILGTLNRSGVQPIILKGPALIQYLYKDPAHRPFSDVDFLIKEEDWAIIRSTLLELGFQTTKNNCAILPPRLTPTDMLNHWFGFYDKNGFHIDCTFDPLQLGLRARLLDAIWGRTLTFQVGSIEAWKLSIEDELLVLCVHLNRHGYQRLIWFLDIAKFIEEYRGQIDWRVLFKLARAENVLPSVYYTLKYINKFFGEIVPTNVINRFNPTWLKAKIWESSWPEAAILTFSGPHEATLVFKRAIFSKYFISNLMLTGRAIEKISYFIRKLFPSKAFLTMKYPVHGTNSGYLHYLFERYRAFLSRQKDSRGLNKS